MTSDTDTSAVAPSGERLHDVNEFLKGLVNEYLDSAAEAEERNRSRISRALGEGPNAVHRIAQYEVPDVSALRGLVYWHVLRGLYQRVQHGACDPVLTDWERSLKDVSLKVFRELVAALRDDTESPVAFARAENRQRLCAYARFLSTSDRLLTQVAERFPEPPSDDATVLLQVIQRAHDALDSDTADGVVSARRELSQALAGVIGTRLQDGVIHIEQEESRR